MLRTSSIFALAAGAIALLVGCAEDFTAPDEPLGEQSQRIINGIPDTSHDAVVAVFTQSTGCSATVIERVDSMAFILTAAHCFGAGPIQQVRIGEDYNDPVQVMNVVEYDVHPQYDPNNQNVYDFAILRAAGATQAMPIIPVLTPQEDIPSNLGVGKMLTHVGYGKTSFPNSNNSVRRYGTGTVAQMGSIQIAYNQPNLGPCQGDSGGPQLVSTPAGERVAGVTSFGEQGCQGFGVSGRPSSVYNSFIAPFIASYDPSTSAATSGGGGGGVGGASGAGGGAGVGVTTGAGANDPGDGWEAGNVPEQNYEGDIVVSGCAAAGDGDGSDAAWLVLILCLLGFRRRSEPR